MVVLAEIVLLSVTLSLGAAVTGFLFGTIGNFTHPAEVEASNAICTHGASELTCTVGLVNLGAGNVNTGGICVMKAGGSTFVGSSERAMVKAGGGETIVQCGASVGGQSTNSRVTGWLNLADGAEVFFAAN
jgi:hypothetical protein